MVAPSRDVPLDGRRALRRRANRGGDEAIAPPRYRLDVARLPRIIVEGRRTSLMAVLSTDSVTKRWPQTRSSNAFFVTSLPGVRASAQSTVKG